MGSQVATTSHAEAQIAHELNLVAKQWMNQTTPAESPTKYTTIDESSCCIFSRKKHVRNDIENVITPTYLTGSVKPHRNEATENQIRRSLRKM